MTENITLKTLEQKLDEAIQPHLPALFGAAEAIVSAGLAFARADDPNRFAALHREFDGGRGVPLFVVEGFGLPEQRIAVRLLGAIDGHERVIELFGLTVAAPQPATEH